jgi:probable H4MPT-linked C1 transfer pathway protein
MSLPAMLGLDIGGANLKAAHGDGSARESPFAVWKDPAGLAPAIASLIATMPPTHQIVATMTAELCDCYATKAEGVRAITAALQQAAGECPVVLWGLDGRFHRPDAAHAQPDLIAAANWLALATVAARLAPDRHGLLIDIGSTTTDLIPLRDGKPAPRGWTDTERLRTGELVYAGVSRTPLCALASSLERPDGPIGVAAEWFATTQDVYVLREAIAEDPDDASTADHRPRTRDHARARIARMIAADPAETSIETARELADAFHERLVDRLTAALLRVLGPVAPGFLVLSGSGAFLARELAVTVAGAGTRTIDLDARWGPQGSGAACARALVELAVTTSPEPAP